MGPGSDGSGRPVRRVLSLHSASLIDNMEIHSGCHWLYCYSEQNLGLLLQTDQAFTFSAASAERYRESRLISAGSRSHSDISIQIAKHPDRSAWSNQLMPADRTVADMISNASELSEKGKTVYPHLLKTTIIMQPMVLK